MSPHPHNVWKPPFLEDILLPVSLKLITIPTIKDYHVVIVLQPNAAEMLEMRVVLDHGGTNVPKDMERLLFNKGALRIDLVLSDPNEQLLWQPLVVHPAFPLHILTTLTSHGLHGVGLWGYPFKLEITLQHNPIQLFTVTPYHRQTGPLGVCTRSHH